MTTRKRLLLLPGALLCASVAMADTAPTSLFQLNGFAGSPAQPGTGGSDPAVAATCTYLVNGVVTSGQVCDNWNLLNGSGSGGSAGHSGTRVYLPGSSSFLFKSGSKDIGDVNTWTYSPTQSAPPKATFTAGFAAAYTGPNDGHLIVQFGGDRGSANGTTDIGIWFFQGSVVPCPQPAGSINFSACNGIASGQFAGKHFDHDIFIWVEFTNGGGTSFVNVYEWDHTNCATGSGTGCVANNLHFLGSETGGNLCGTTVQCGVVNSTTTHTSWEGDVVNPLFFEGGLDVTAALATAGVTNPPCFSSFELETRSSATINSELKAFLVGNFPTCSVAISKVCAPTQTPRSPFPKTIGGVTYVHYDFTGKVINDGLGNIYNLTVADTFPPNSLNTVLNQPSTPSNGLQGGASANYSGSFEVPTDAEVTNHVTASAASSNGGSLTVTLDKTGSPAVSDAKFGGPAPAISGCAISLSPLLSLTKSCLVGLAPGSGGIVLKDNTTITVCNTSPDNLAVISGITLTNNVLLNGPGSGTDSNVASNLSLNPGQCQTYTPSYTPSQCSGGAPTTDGGRCQFTDTVRVDTVASTPKDQFGHNVPANDIPLPKQATCSVCPFGACTLSGTP